MVEGAWTGPLTIVIDNETASAAEYFAATLQDHVGATVVGSRTVGAGCGYTGGRVALTLPHSQLSVRFLDRIRLRRDGTNERDGVAPDFDLRWHAITSSERRAATLIKELNARAVCPKTCVGTTSRCSTRRFLCLVHYVLTI